MRSVDQRERLFGHCLRVACVDPGEHLTVAQRPRKALEQATNAGQPVGDVKVFVGHGSKDARQPLTEEPCRSAPCDAQLDPVPVRSVSVAIEAPEH